RFRAPGADRCLPSAYPCGVRHSPAPGTYRCAPGAGECRTPKRGGTEPEQAPKGRAWYVPRAVRDVRSQPRCLHPHSVPSSTPNPKEIIMESRSTRLVLAGIAILLAVLVFRPTLTLRAAD